jgi:flagellar biosynthesis/type III secretory pathway chaperone
MTATASTTTAEAEKAIAQVVELMEKLRGVIEQETTLVHAGKVRNAAALGAQKSELTSKLYLTGESLKANAKFLLQAAPGSAAALAKVQEAFRAVLQRNMIVLATAHAVSEGIVRRLSGDLARKAAPQVYGASGRATAPDPRQGKPLAVSRVL